MEVDRPESLIGSDSLRGTGTMALKKALQHPIAKLSGFGKINKNAFDQRVSFLFFFLTRYLQVCDEKGMIEFDKTFFRAAVVGCAAFLECLRTRIRNGLINFYKKVYRCQQNGRFLSIVNI